jgi:hypothetical protein
VITDLICALLPIVVLWRVKISFKAKFGVCGLMSLGLIATAVAIIRASSLGIKTADLSYDYCIAAIWANTELHLGIIATNLALSRMIWALFFGERESFSSSNTPRYGTGTQFSRTKHGYMKSGDERGPFTEEDLDTKVSFDTQSQASHIPLHPIIRRTTDIHVSSFPSKEIT